MLQTTCTCTNISRYENTTIEIGVEAVTGKRNVSKKLYGAKLNGRSKITNGTRLLPSVDGRSLWARRLRDLINLYQSDRGGPDMLTTAEQSIIRRISTLQVELEHLEMRFAGNGEATPDELILYGRTANTLRRLTETIGIERRPRDVTPSLDQYLANREAAE